MRWYRLDSTKLSFREYWRWRPGLVFLFLACRRVLGIRNTHPQFVARPETLLLIDLALVHRRHRVALDPLLEEARALGFKMEFCYTIPSRGPNSAVAVALTSADNLSLGLLIHAQAVNAPRPLQPVHTFFSRHADGRLLATTGGPPGLLGSPPEYQVVRLRHSSLEQTWHRHTERIRSDSGNLLRFRSDEVADALLRILQHGFDYNRSRGVWVPVEDFEVPRLR